MTPTTPTTTMTTPTTLKAVRRYRFDLDTSAEERWGPILTDFKGLVPQLKKTVEIMMEVYGVKGLVVTALDGLIALNRHKAMHLEELEYISKVTEIPFSHLLVMQLLYEASAACTCVVTRVGGRPVMVRTMDWSLPILKEITVELEFVRGGRTLFVAPTWVGCVGVFTAYLPGDDAVGPYAMAINYRRTQDMGTFNILRNLYRVISMAWPVSYLVRDIAERRVPYADALTSIQTARLVSPCYVTMTTLSESATTMAVVTRDADSARSDIQTQSVIQTNCDKETMEPDILWSRERCRLATALLEARGNDWDSLDELIHSLLVHPILNDETIYVSVITEGSIVTGV